MKIFGSIQQPGAFTSNSGPVPPNATSCVSLSAAQKSDCRSATAVAPLAHSALQRDKILKVPWRPAGPRLGGRLPWALSDVTVLPSDAPRAGRPGVCFLPWKSGDFHSLWWRFLDWSLMRTKAGVRHGCPWPRTLHREAQEGCVMVGAVGRAVLPSLWLSDAQAPGRCSMPGAILSHRSRG